MLVHGHEFIDRSRDFAKVIVRGSVPCLTGVLAIINGPKALLMITEVKQAIARIVPLAALGAGNEAAQVHSLAIIVLGNSEAQAATAGDQEHAEILALRGIRDGRLPHPRSSFDHPLH
jgi:hypothetical protein